MPKHNPDPSQSRSTDEHAVRAAGDALREAKRAAAAGTGSEDAVRAAQKAFWQAMRQWDAYAPHRAFLDAIDAAPNDPAPVLRWADWLDEHDGHGFPHADTVRAVAKAGITPRKMPKGAWELHIEQFRAMMEMDKAVKLLKCSSLIVGSASAAWLALAERE
jgi:uncharacterized protein (TIGR02996 family)